MHTYIHTHTERYRDTCIHSARAKSFRNTFMHGYIHTTYIHTYITHIHYTHTYIHKNIHTYIHENIHTYTYVHIYAKM